MSKHLARVHSAELEGINAKTIEVEVDLNVGLHSFNIVGLADKAVNEARERVNAALKNSDIKPPSRENRKITVNLAPADIKKAGSQYDLAIAVGYLLATGQIKTFDPGKIIFVGELALDGRLRPIHGALNIAQHAAQKNFSRLYLPVQNRNEAAVIKGVEVIGVESLKEIIDDLEGRANLKPATFVRSPKGESNIPDLAHVRGQAQAKRALTIAAAGGHNLLMIGPPGVGKSLLAQALSGILPSLEPEEAIEVTKIYSAANAGLHGLIEDRPFRSPHHTASLISIIGGGPDPRPGEISLAHRGVLFLDELPEFPKNTLESLRQPLEAGAVHVARARRSLIFPAKFMLVAAMNPCPCGFFGDEEKKCRCGAYEVIRYQKKISGPLLDRIDLQIRVPRIPLENLRARGEEEEASESVRRVVQETRQVQAKRFSKLKILTNSEMSSRETEIFSLLKPESEKFLSTIRDTHLSPRSFYRLLKTARTIADLEQAEQISPEHLAEAFSYRLREEV